MGIFNRHKTADLWANGTRTTGTVEQVHVTGVEHETGAQTHSHEAIVVLRFADAAGAEVFVQRTVWVAYPPAPGSGVDIAYLPDDLEKTADYDHDHVRPPDLSSPRGWSAGVFEVPAAGPYPPVNRDSDLNGERRLFQAGPQREAVVTHRSFGMLLERHGNVKCKLRLGVDGTEYEKEFWVDPQLAPDEDDHVQIVVSTDGQVALDTDERYYGPPGRCVVWSVPPEVQEMRNDPNGVQSQLFWQQKMLDAGKITQPQFDAMKAQLLGPQPGVVPGAGTPQLAALEKARDSGDMSQEDFDRVTRKLFGAPAPAEPPPPASG
jgi:Short C-terminal domain